MPQSSFPYLNSVPFDSGSGQQADQAEYRRIGSAWGDGIINDLTGLAFSVTPSSSDRTIVLTVNEIRLRAVETIPISSTVTITLPSVATGFTRCDRLIAHYDPTDKSVSLIYLEGSPVNTGAGTEPIPALTQNSGGVWEVTLWRFTGGNVAASLLAKVDERQWVGQQYLVPTPTQLALLTASAGSTALALSNGHTYLLQLVSGTLTWVDRSAPTWTTWNTGTSLGSGFRDASNIAATLAAPRARKRLGQVEWEGTIARTSGANMQGAGVAIGSVPAGMEPARNREFSVATHYDGSTADSPNARVEITAGGAVLLYAASPTSWFSLDGISYEGATS